jgi:hypothetical protein
MESKKGTLRRRLRCSSHIEIERIIMTIAERRALDRDARAAQHRKRLSISPGSRTEFEAFANAADTVSGATAGH